MEPLEPLEHESLSRRPLKSRGTRWAAALARRLAAGGLTPNQISMASILFAATAAAALLIAGRSESVWRAASLAGAAAFIQLRLLCNLMDGMVAIEGGRRTRLGEIYNDLPDRIADTLILISAGYAFPGYGFSSALGWAAALAAMMTAYVRMLGGTVGLPQDFRGPMAKQHRMAVMTVACLVEAALAATAWPGRIMSAALAVITLGSLVTVCRRTRGILEALASR